MKYEIMLEDSSDNNKKIMNSYPTYGGDDFRACLYKLAVDLFKSEKISVGGYGISRSIEKSYWTMNVYSEEDNVDINMDIKKEYSIQIEAKKDIDFN